MNAWWVVVLAGVAFTGAAQLGVKLSAAVCRAIVPFHDGPRVAKPPVAALLVAAATIGIVLAARGADISTLSIVCILATSLAACFYSDVRCGIVPDYFTLVPLVLVLGVSLFERNVTPLIAAVVVFVPFAVMALASKGLGMGWGDVKLVALGAAVLGLQISILSFAAACLAAVVVATVRRRFREPIAFAPYLASAIAFGCVFAVTPPGLSP